MDSADPIVPGIWPAFKRYFITAQLTAGLGLASKGFVTDGALGAVVGFLVAAPITAVIVFIKVLVDRRSEGRPAPQGTRWVGAVMIGLAICAGVIGIGLLLRLAA